MTHREKRAQVRVALSAEGSFPQPDYEKVLRLIGTKNSLSAILDLGTTSVKVNLLGGFTLQAGEIAEVHGIQVQDQADGPDIAVLQVTRDD
jgi:hypothetical protein